MASKNPMSKKVKKKKKTNKNHWKPQGRGFVLEVVGKKDRTFVK